MYLRPHAPKTCWLTKREVEEARSLIEQNLSQEVIAAWFAVPNYVIHGIAEFRSYWYNLDQPIRNARTAKGKNSER
jgi:hypothetical protein